MQVSYHQHRTNICKSVITNTGRTYASQSSLTQDERMQVSHHQGASPTFTQDAHMQVSHHEGVDYH
jgi:hypothetical protein